MSKGQVQFKDVKLPSDKQRAETEVEASAVSTTGSEFLLSDPVNCRFPLASTLLSPACLQLENLSSQRQ
jgi:hypothetical protein